MDFATIGGFLFAMVMILLGAYFEHVTLDSMLGPSAFLIVVGGSMGATIFSHTMSELRRLPSVTKMALVPPTLDFNGTIEYLVKLSEKARRNGLLSLQEDADQATHPLIRRGLTMAVDGQDPEQVLEVLESMIETELEAKNATSAVWDTAGGYSPTIGILGTVMGLVTVMGDLSEPEKLGPAIAVAFLATLYGVGFANLVFLPLGTKIKGVIKQEAKYGELIVQGITALQSGENPRSLREKLSIYAVSATTGKVRGDATQTAEEGV